MESLAQNARVLRYLRAHAVGIIELGANNAHIVSVTLRPRARTKVIAVLGKERNGERTSLCEVGVSKGNPWGGARGDCFNNRKRPELYTLPPRMRNALLKLIREIAWRRIRKWQTGGYFIRTCKNFHNGSVRPRGVLHYHNGIRFTFDPHDTQMVEFLRWHEALHNRDVQGYLTYRARGISRRLASRALGSWTSRTRNKTVREAALRVQWFFERSRTLRDPYVMCSLLERLFPGYNLLHKPHPQMQLLIDMGIIQSAHFDAMRRRPHLDHIPLLGMQVRYVGKRKNGFLIFEVYPTSEFISRQKKHPPTYNPVDASDCPF